MYLKYLEDNLNEKYTKEMDEYRKYMKLYYTDKARCPVDPKILLEKRKEKSLIELWCKLKSGKTWRVYVKEPIILNLKLELMELLDEYKNNGIIFKNMLKENLKMGILNPERDDKIKEMLKDLKKKEEKIEEIRKVFDREKEVVDELLVERQEYLKKLAEIKIKKGNLYKKCETIDNVVCRKLKEISLNENDIKEQRYIQIAKNTNLEVENVKNWINYFKYVVEYLKENNELHLINTRISELKQKFEKINNHFIIGIPDISIEGKSKEIKMKK